LLQSFTVFLLVNGSPYFITPQRFRARCQSFRTTRKNPFIFYVYFWSTVSANNSTSRIKYILFHFTSTDKQKKYQAVEQGWTHAIWGGLRFYQQYVIHFC